MVKVTGIRRLREIPCIIQDYTDAEAKIKTPIDLDALLNKTLADQTTGGYDVYSAPFLFVITSSVICIVSDIIDVEKDKLHPIKRLRFLLLRYLFWNDCGGIACI